MPRIALPGPASRGCGTRSQPPTKKIDLPNHLRSTRMLDPATIEAIADELLDDARSRTPVPRLTARYPDMTVEDSYAVQQLWRRRNVEAGRTLVGRKSGLTSKGMPAATG